MVLNREQHPSGYITLITQTPICQDETEYATIKNRSLNSAPF